MKTPAFRKLRGYAFDPSLSLAIDTVGINDIIYRVPWEDDLERGPIGEYIEVVDYDPTTKQFYEPVDLDARYLLAQDGLEPSESNPEFHQQMVYAVTMTTIKNFEAALGRPILWCPRAVSSDKAKTIKTDIIPNKNNFTPRDQYVQRLRIYPHAFRDANAYYSPQKKALLFGYFSSAPAEETLQMPNTLVFTCLSHDIIAHETTHAILDGMYEKYTESTNPDVLAFHEAFADIVALFQHFTFPEVLKHQIAKTKGDLACQNLLGQLAQQFGTAIGNYGALRDAIGYTDENNVWHPKIPNGDEYRTITEPHARGSILVSAVFEAFIAIYKSRIADLLRISTGGTGILPQGELHPDLINRLAEEAAKTSGHVLKMCIRALDYCPPVDITFGDYLRAIITADVDLIEDDRRDYRLAFIDAFRKRGIYPSGIKNLSIESLCYQNPNTEKSKDLFVILTKFLREFSNEIIYLNNRRDIFNCTIEHIVGRIKQGEKDNVLGLHERIDFKFHGSRAKEFELLTGLKFSYDWERLGIRTSTVYKHKEAGPTFQICGLKLASRVGPDGNQSNQIILSIIQRAGVTIGADGKIITFQPDDKKEKAENSFEMRGGCTLIFDLDTLTLKYAIAKPLLDLKLLEEKSKYKLDEQRLMNLFHYMKGDADERTEHEAYFSPKRNNINTEPFSFLHNH